ncbi:MAG: pyroglutamyl-peptidase I [Verrucomicrobiota bacterium]
MSANTILLTGFGPYANVSVNPAQTVTEALDGETIAGAKLHGHILPGGFFKCIEAITALIDEMKPDLVVMMGEYSGRSMLTVERIAQNFDDATRYGLEDNFGYSPTNEKIVEDGPVAYWSNAPIRAMVKAMRAANVPADISDAAGTLCCNHLMYGALHHINSNGLPIRAAWIHLPTLPEVAAHVDHLNMPSMSTETSVTGVRAGIQAMVENEKDIQEVSPSRFQI